MDNLFNVVYESLLFELNIFPKPGLVTPFDNGTHKDLDYKLMQRSAFFVAKEIDRVKESLKTNHDFKSLQALGLEMETELLKYCKTNTHKGYIFIVLIVLNSYLTTKSFDEFVDKCKHFGKESLVDLNNNVFNTNGAKLFKKYPELKGGIRYTVSEMDSIINTSNYNDNYQKILYLISEVEDTCIIHRGDIELWKEVKQKAKDCLDNYSFDNYKNICKYFNDNNLSAGGVADIIAIDKLISLLFNDKDKTTNILDAREYKYNLLTQLYKVNNNHIITINLNIPGLEKQNIIHINILNKGLDLIKTKLDICNVIYISNNAGDSMMLDVSNKDTKQIKEILCEVELLKPHYRLFDFDVYETPTKLISRSDYNIKPRQCFICDELAHVCNKNQTHTISELKNIIEKWYNIFTSQEG